MDAFVMYFYSHEVRLSINCVSYVCHGVFAAGVAWLLSAGAKRCSRYVAYIQVANLHFFLETGPRLTAKNACKDLKTRKKAHFGGIPVCVIVFRQSRAANTRQRMARESCLCLTV